MSHQVLVEWHVKKKPDETMTTTVRCNKYCNKLLRCVAIHFFIFEHYVYKLIYNVKIDVAVTDLYHRYVSGCNRFRIYHNVTVDVSELDTLN